MFVVNIYFIIIHLRLGNIINMYKMRFSGPQIFILDMKKIFIFVCMILGSCAFVGCTGNGTAQSEQKDSVAVDSIEVVDSLDSIALDSIICPN